MKQLLLVFLGGGLGSFFRYWISKQFTTLENGFPYGTFIVNITGSLLIGLILGYALKNNSLNSNTVLFLATGICGGFTTFSAFAYENLAFLKAGDITSFALYAGTSLIFGFVAVFLGMWLIKFI
jgi:CrcB protein